MRDRERAGGRKNVRERETAGGRKIDIKRERYMERGE